MKQAILSLCLFMVWPASAVHAEGETDRATLDRLTALLVSPEYQGYFAANYCVADFDMDGTTDHAFGTVTNSPVFGAYFVQLGDRVIELAHHNTHPELQCLDAEETRKLNSTIESSETVHGSIEKGDSDHVVCGFVKDTEAVCWGYDQTGNDFVVVGGWTT